ncbi:MAG TPA: GNAT family N-acetyltransferase [Candidatus Limnocylindrales bacterium]|nr:GNAT family N-acetyltransferase [Candidatus Limnocylindrales bacterium]
MRTMIETTSLSPIEKLTEDHDISSFHSGKPPLDDWLRRFALINQNSDAARTYVIHRVGRVVGYYSLAAGAVRREESPARVAKGLAKHPIGVILLARLAVDRTEQGKGLGKMLLVDALTRSLAAADSVGARAILVHALDDEAVAFYRRYGFETSPLDPRQLMLRMKDLRATLKSVGHL